MIRLMMGCEHGEIRVNECRTLIVCVFDPGPHLMALARCAELAVPRYVSWPPVTPDISAGLLETWHPNGINMMNQRDANVIWGNQPIVLPLHLHQVASTRLLPLTTDHQE